MSYMTKREYIENTSMIICEICGRICRGNEVCEECYYQAFIGNMEYRKEIKELENLRRIQCEVAIKIEENR